MGRLRLLALLLGALIGLIAVTVAYHVPMSEPGMLEVWEGG